MRRASILFFCTILGLVLIPVRVWSAYYSLHQLESFDNTVGFRNQAQNALDNARGYLYVSTEFAHAPHWGHAGPLHHMKIFIPPGAYQLSFVMYVYRDDQVALVFRHKRPPDCTYCSDDYRDLTNHNRFDGTLTSLIQYDLYLTNNGGTMALNIHLGPPGSTTGIGTDEAGWLYIDLLPYNSDYIQLLQVRIDYNRQVFENWFQNFDGWDAYGDPIWGDYDGNGGNNGGGNGGGTGGGNGGGNGGSNAWTDGDYDFSLNAGWLVMECDRNECRGEIPFSITPITDLYGTDLRNWCRQNESSILSTVRNMRLSFDPCFIYRPDNYGDIPDGYDVAVRLDYGNSPCPSAGTPLCLITASIDPDSVTLTDYDTCIVEGNIVFVVSGAENVANCRNLPHKIPDPEDPTRETVTRSDVSVVFNTTIAPDMARHYGGPITIGHSFTLVVPGQKAQEINDFSPLGAYEVKIRVVEARGNTATLKAYIVDASGHYTTFPSNVTPVSGSWTGAAVQAGSGDAFESTRIATVNLPQSGEFRVRYTLTVKATVTDAGGRQETRNITYRSNEIRFFAPVSCEDDESPVCVYRPPILRPIPPEDLMDRTQRPIFTGLVDANGDGHPETPDYSHYTGRACDSCLATERSYVDRGYWTGMAAKDGIWEDWVADPTKGRVGYRFFTFVNARPWDVYNYCPRTVVVRPGGGDVYDSCLDPRSLACPTGHGRNIVDGSEYTLLWTVNGWECWNYLCKELPKDIDGRDLKCN